MWGDIMLKRDGKILEHLTVYNTGLSDQKYFLQSTTKCYELGR